MTTPQTSIEVENLTKIYGRTKAINHISFTVHPGEVVGFLGPNGAGKSTTMRILSGLTAATSGIARIYGTPVSINPQQTKQYLGYMPEHNPLPEEVRVIEYLRYRAKLKKVPPKLQKKRIENVMELCGLARTAGRKIIGKLSKGYRQRVGIADCLLGEPKVVIMDEPTIGLDPHQIIGIRKLIDSLRGEVTVLLSSHILAEIETSCDRVIIINQGHIVAEGTNKSLRKQFIPEATYQLLINADLRALEYLLKKLDPKIQISRDEQKTKDGFQIVTLNTKKPECFGETLASHIQAHPNWRLREIVRKEPTLEDVFLAATRPSWNTELANFPKRRNLPYL